MHFESEIFSLLQKEGLRSVHLMFGAWSDHGRIIGLWSVKSSFCWQKQLADLSLKLWSGRIAACSEISLLLLLHSSLRNEFVTLSWLALNYIVGHESVTAVPARFCTIQCCNLSRLATRLPSPIVFCILRLGVDIWCCLFSLKVETNHACAHHTGSITFCRSKLVFGVWGTCIFRSLFFARVCTPPNHPQYSIYLTGVYATLAEHGYRKRHGDMDIVKQKGYAPGFLQNKIMHTRMIQHWGTSDESVMCLVIRHCLHLRAAVAVVDA